MPSFLLIWPDILTTMKKLKNCFLLAIAVIMTACSTAGINGPRFDETPKRPLRQDAALIYVYRVGYTYIKLGSVQISVNDKLIFGVKDRGFTAFYLRPGKHQFKAEWPLMEKPLFEEGHFDPKTLTVDAEAGKTYYINYLIQESDQPITYMEQSSLLGKALSKSRILFAGLVQENEATGLSNLSICKQQDNEAE